MQQRNLHKQKDVLKTWWKEAKTIFLPSEKSWMTNSRHFSRLSLLPEGKQTFSLWLLLSFSFAQRAHMSGDIYWMLIETQWTVKDSSGGSESCTGSVYLIRPWLNPRPQKRCSLWMFWCWKCERMNLFKVVNQQKCQNLQLKDEIKWFCAKYSNTAAAAAQKYPEGRLVKYNIFVQNV